MTAWQRDPLAELEEEETRPRGFAPTPTPPPGPGASERPSMERASFVRLRPHATMILASESNVARHASGVHDANEVGASDVYDGPGAFVGSSGVDFGAEAPATTWPKFPVGSSEPYGTARVTADLRRRWVGLGAHIDKLIARIVAVERGASANLPVLEALRARAHEFNELREALYEVQLDVGEPTVERLFGEHGSVSPYLTGLYIWCEDSLDALEGAALTSDAWVLHARLDQAAHYYFDGLVPRMRDEVDRLRGMRTFGAEYDPVELFGEHLEELFFAASYLHERLAKGLGR